MSSGMHLDSTDMLKPKYSKKFRRKQMTKEPRAYFLPSTYRDREGNAISHTVWKFLVNDPAYRIVKQTVISEGPPRCLVSTAWLGLEQRGITYFETVVFLDV